MNRNMKLTRITTPLIAAAFGAMTAFSATAQDLTTLGAEAAANAAGTIPAWTGDVLKAPAGAKPGILYPDPYAAEKPTLVITAANAEEHKAQLSAGQLATLKKYPSYRINVYPTHRTGVFPKGYFDETKANAGKAKLSDSGNGVLGVTGGLPFPTPKNGSEAIWNALTRYRGETYATDNVQLAVTRGGEYTPVRFQYLLDFNFAALNKKPAERADNLLFYFLQRIVAPARLAGSVLLVHEPLDQTKVFRSAWTYNPGQRRVRQAPNVAYDNPGTAADGLRTNDDFGIYNGATDRYDFELVGKKEIYIPYNSYKLSSGVKLEDVTRAGHLNPELVRHELHRVWVVDSKLKKGTSHLYARRTYYLDEDTWAPVLVDKYDGRGELFRTGELHSIQLWDVPMYYGTIEVHSDLQSGRYLALGVRTGDDKMYAPSKLTAADFTPASLRESGVR
ncbi:DUF1329 domain-containing protein [Nevskia sp.]|uniref:DUF1329 domain-containing protein n=1 Tax=Nevskia sp. TaxID=1929292 RepID=UPI0025E9487C|nr:DUF1329 domain-containing protein [Nevskia sp.]